jgi:dTDP-4-dehydrorhamnose reductase
MRILLTGKNGQLGWELHRHLERDYEVLAIGREDVDFLDLRFLDSMLRFMPKLDLIVNAAAYTDMDRAEHESFTAEAVNSEAAFMLAKEAARRKIPMIHFSSNYVFSGRRRTVPYRENDQPSPTSVYSATKLDGETRIRSILEKHLIFRLSGLYGIHHRNFFTEILARNRGGIVSRAATDQVISPNWTPIVAEAVVDVIQQWSWGEKIPWGTYHLSGGGSTTPYEFARMICEKINDLWGGNMPLPTPTTSRKFRTATKRPKYSVLNPALFNKTFQSILPDWREQFLLFFGGLDPTRVKR